LDFWDGWEKKLKTEKLKAEIGKGGVTGGRSQKSGGQVGRVRGKRTGFVGFFGMAGGGAGGDYE
jgi:hypothetical protein